MTTVYITHGYTAHPDNHWFPWLAQKITEQGAKCVVLAMPDSAHPTPEAWLAYHQAQIETDEEVILIGHSLGCIALLNFLACTQPKHVKGAIFVSGFYEKIPHLPELDCFVNFYAKQTACLPRKSYVVSSLTDNIVPHAFSDRLAQYLGADYLRLPQGGHFLDREGVTELLEVWELVQKLMAVQ